MQNVNRLITEQNRTEQNRMYYGPMLPSWTNFVIN